MGFVQADLGSWCACEYGNQLVYLHMPHWRITLQPFAASRLHWRAGPLRSSTAIRKTAGLFCGSFLRKGKVFTLYTGRIQNLKGLKQYFRADPSYRRAGCSPIHSVEFEGFFRSFRF